MRPVVTLACLSLSSLGLAGCGGDTTGDSETTEDSGTSETTVVDLDEDGVPEEDDCDDADASLGAVARDADCDGTLTEDDCDDTDANSNILAEDGDCDGSLTLDDCDDDNALAYPGAEERLLDSDVNCDGELGGSLSRADYGFVGENSDDYAGSSVSNAGDVDGDGLDDLLVGAFGNGGGGSVAGKVYLILGGSLGSSSTIDLSLADYSFWGENKEDFDYAGYSVSSAGDVDGDGLDDLLVGAHGNGDNGSDAGKVYLILGNSLASSPALELSLADHSLVGENPNDHAGISVSSAGDVDGDGLDDLLVGAFGNGDGGSDAGKAYLVLGSSLGSTSTLDLSQADHGFVGEGTDDHAGNSVSNAGDVDGDGLDDLLVGADWNDDGGPAAGKAYLILGSSLGSSSTTDLSLADHSFVGEDINDHAANSVSSAGDVDGDGLDDLLVGSRYNQEGGRDAGKAYLILSSSMAMSSSTDLSHADYSFVGEITDDEAGFSVSGAGDVDGDSLDDLLIGAHLNDDAGSKAGKVYLILGNGLASSSTIDLSLADYSFIGENSREYAGTSVSGAGDVDGNGLDDLLLGAHYNEDGGTGAGKAYLILSHL